MTKNYYELKKIIIEKRCEFRVVHPHDRGVTFEDVLILLGNFENEWGINGTDFEFFEEDKPVACWELGSGLEHQSEETIDFLLKLIKKIHAIK